MAETKKYTPKAAAKPAQSKPSLVKMQRDDGKTADVHPTMIENYRKGGYQEVK